MESRGGGFEDARDKLQPMGVPVPDRIDAVAKFGEEGLLVHTHDAGVFADMPLGERRPLPIIHQTLEVGVRGKEGESDVQDLVGIWATTVLLESIAGGCHLPRCESRDIGGERPAHIHRS